MQIITHVRPGKKPATHRGRPREAKRTHSMTIAFIRHFVCPHSLILHNDFSWCGEFSIQSIHQQTTTMKNGRCCELLPAQWGSILPWRSQNNYSTSCVLRPFTNMNIEATPFLFYVFCSLPYSSYFGGVVGFKSAQFRLINGLSNVYWGWCCEDDDLGQRLTTAQLRTNRYSGQTGHYKAITKNHFRSSNHSAGESEK